MSNLKDQLIKLGSQQPELRKHLKPILDHLTRKASSAEEQAKNIKEFKRMLQSDAVRKDELKKVYEQIEGLHLTSVNKWLSKKMERFLDDLQRRNIMLSDKDMEAAKKIHKAFQKFRLKILNKVHVSTELREALPFEVWNFIQMWKY